MDLYQLTGGGDFEFDDDGRRSAISSLSKRHEDTELAEVLINGYDLHRIRNADELKSFYYVRHNWIHYLICMNFNIPFSDSTTLSSFLTSGRIQNPDCIMNHKYWELIKKQTPDIIEIDSNGTILLIDVTVRSSEEYARREKQAKYLTMQVTFEDCGYKSEVIPIVIDSAARITQVDQVIDQLDDLKLARNQSFKDFRSMILRILDTAKEIEKQSRLLYPLEFNMWLKVGENVDTESYKINLTDSEVISIIKKQPYNPFGQEDILKVLEDHNLNQLELTQKDESFLEDCSQATFNIIKDEFVKNMEPFLGSKSGIDASIEKYEAIMRSNSLKYPVFKQKRKAFIFPFLQDMSISKRGSHTGDDLLNILSRTEGTDHHSNLFKSLFKQLNLMKMKPDKREFSIFSGISEYLENHLQIDRSDTGCIAIPMDQVSKARHQSEGPGRKQLLTKGFLSRDPTVSSISKESIRKASEKKTSIIDWDSPTNDLEDFIQAISRFGEHADCLDLQIKESFDKFPVMDEMAQRLVDLLSTCLCVKWLSIIQMIAQEISRNATRKRKGNKYCVSLCQDRRYGIILAPGFRITSTGKPIWFKIFSTAEFPEFEELGPEIYHHGGFWSTEWRSIDIYQLESFIRIRDSFIMSFLSYCETTNPGRDDVEHVRFMIESSDMIGMMASLMVAHNRSTSSVIQSSRYLALRMMSINPDPWTLLKKDFNIPVRNPILHLMLKRLMRFIKLMKQYKMEDLQGKMRSGFDKITGDVLDLDVDQPDDLPSLFSNMKGQSFSGLLCEMYFCMLFNKNQDEPSAAALSILEKIVIEESKLQNESLPEGFETGLLPDDVCIEIAKSGFHSHFFSAHAVCLGSKLQSRHKHNKKPKGSAVLEVIENNKFVKSLDKYATFKASTISIERKADLRSVDPTMGFDDIEDIDTIDDMTELERISREFNLSSNEFNILIKRSRGEQLTPAERYINNGMIRKMSLKANPLRSLANRTKCVVNVVDLLSRNTDVVTNVDYLRKHIRDMSAIIQIFKKNQIGGVREIEIMAMDMRMLLEYVERVPTSISKSDEREMISAKQRKGEIIKANVMKMLTDSAGKSVLNLNSCRDMSKWSQAFMCIIFFYTMLPYRCLIPDYVRTNLVAQVLMSNKRFELPAKLVELWLKNPNERHKEPEMQKLKESFLSQDRSSMDCSFLCKSGMGQGLEQTGSTFLHLCQLSFRDEIFKRTCSKLKDYCLSRGFNIDLWNDYFDAVSSDDKSTYKLMSSKFPDNIICLSAFKIVEKFTESLFCMQDSERKSVELINLAEFNSEFTMRYNQYSPLIKFAHKSTLIPDTRSPLRAISQMFGTVRELRANGASSFLCRIAHLLNKDFIETIFHTKRGMRNDPSSIIFCRRIHCPADLGVYPIFQPELMDMVGLEYHNYLLMSTKTVKQTVKDILCFIYQSEKTMLNFDLTSVERDLLADVLPRRIHIEISVGMSANLVIARKNCPVSKETLERSLDPSNGEFKIIDFIGQSKTNKVALLRSASLLYTLGAKDSFKNTNGALYYARIGAMATGNCFHIRNAESVETDKGLTRGSTFKELMVWLTQQSMEYQNISNTYKILKHFKIYDLCRITGTLDTFKPRKPGFRLLKSRKMKTYSKSVILHNSLSTLLNYKWGNRDKREIVNELERDWEILKRRMPYLQDTEEQTLTSMNVKYSGINIYKLLLELVSVTSEKNEFSKWLLVGQSTSDLLSTAMVLRHGNSFGGLMADTPDFTNVALAETEGSPISMFRYTINSFLIDINLAKGEMEVHDSKERFRKFIRDVKYRDNYLLDYLSKLCRDNLLEIGDTKKLLMTQLLLGLSESEIQDTLYNLNHSYVVWAKEQEKDLNGNWSGEFDVIIKSGRSSLRMKGKDDLRSLSFEFHSTQWDPFQMYNLLDTLVKIWRKKGLKELSMHEIKMRCREVRKPTHGMLLLNTTDLRVPELRLSQWSRELIPLMEATGWRSEDLYFDYREIEIELENVIKLSTKTRRGRKVRFTGIFNGLSPIHPSEIKFVENQIGKYPSKLVQTLTKAGYQTNTRSLNRLDPTTLDELIGMLKPSVLIDVPTNDKMASLNSKYNFNTDFTSSDISNRNVVETEMYDRLLSELSAGPVPDPNFQSDSWEDYEDEDAFLNDITMESALELLNEPGVQGDFMNDIDGFGDETFSSSIIQTHKLKPKLIISQPPVSWPELMSIYEIAIKKKYMPKLTKTPNEQTWIDAMSSLFLAPREDNSLKHINSILFKYCFENIRLVDEGIQTLFLNGILSLRDIMGFNPEPLNLTFISMAVKSH